MNHRIGFMQGRLCEPVDGKIQAFPWRGWENEIGIAAGLNLHVMEWTLDQDRLYENPLMTNHGRAQITRLAAEHSIDIPSVTGDCFMQSPFWKTIGEERSRLETDFLAVCRGGAALGVQLIVVPLVDNGRLDDRSQENSLVDFLLSHHDFFAGIGIGIVFESDYGPCDLGRFIERLPDEVFGVNYDIGNSAALGFDPVEEFAAYGARIRNVHVKDRVLGGTTVPLTAGAADFETVFSELAAAGYRGNFILQTARSPTGDHAGVLRSYYEMTVEWLKRSRPESWVRGS